MLPVVSSLSINWNPFSDSDKWVHKDKNVIAQGHKHNLLLQRRSLNSASSKCDISCSFQSQMRQNMILFVLVSSFCIVSVVLMRLFLSSETTNLQTIPLVNKMFQSKSAPWVDLQLWVYSLKPEMAAFSFYFFIFFKNRELHFPVSRKIKIYSYIKHLTRIMCKNLKPDASNVQFH